MLARCSYPNYPRYHDYGGRGIKVCKRWHLFINFLADMGSKPLGMTLDRINNNGNYTPTNCRWTTYQEQNRNSRQTKMTLAKAAQVRASTKTNVELAAQFGVTAGAISHIRNNRTWR